MSEQTPESKSPKQMAQERREDRIAKALRDNLRRRKTAVKQIKLKNKN